MDNTFVYADGNFGDEVKGLPWFKIICLGILLYMAVQIVLALPSILLFCIGAVATWQYVSEYCLGTGDE